MSKINAKTEGDLKSALVRKLREFNGYIVIRHEDNSRSGIPDISVTARGKTTWWEVKYGRPDFESKGVQELTMLRLARHGYARYIIYRETADGKTRQTSIAHPQFLNQKENYGYWDTVSGFNHEWVIEQIRLVHES